MVNSEALAKAKQAALAELGATPVSDLNRIHGKVIGELLNTTREALRALSEGRRTISPKQIQQLSEDLPLLWVVTVEGVYQRLSPGEQNGPAKPRKSSAGHKGIKRKGKPAKSNQGSGGGRKKKKLPDGMLTSLEASGYLGVSPATMGYWRKVNSGPVYQTIKVGKHRQFAYAIDDLDAYQSGKKPAPKKPAPKKPAPKEPAPKKPAPQKPQLRKRTLTSREAAEYLGLTYKQIENLRRKPDGPKFTAKGSGYGKRIFYRIEDLDAWKESQTE